MFKRVIVGAVLGIVGKKLYDEGKLQPYIAKAKTRLTELSESDAPAARVQTVPAKPA